MPSSLTMLLPSALGFSPHPPVSVYGTGVGSFIAAFLGGLSSGFATYVRSDSHSLFLKGVFPPFPKLYLPRILLTRVRYRYPRPHISDCLQYRTFHLLSIGYAFRPRLRSRLSPGRSALPGKPWIFGRGDSHPTLATHSGILPSCNSTIPFGTASLLSGMLPYRCLAASPCFGAAF